MTAAKSGAFAIVELLLKYKPDVDIKDSVSQVVIIITLCLIDMTPDFSYRKTKLHAIWQQIQKFDTVSKNNR